MNDLEQEIVALKEHFDLYTDRKDANGLKTIISKANDLLAQDLSVEQIVSLNYSIATAYADIEGINLHELSYSEIETIQENYIYHYRAVLDNVEKIESDTNGLYQQLYTNAANAYSRIGRILEAMRLFDIASSKYNMFPMALGNKGIAAYKLALYTYDPSHAHILRHFSYFCINDALKYRQYLDLHGKASVFFESIIANIQAHYPKDYLDVPIDFGKYDFGKTKKEQGFRKWATLNRLFLNELNDISTDPIVATDYIHLPSMIYDSSSERWKFHYGMFNQIKQEYVSARYLFFDGIQDRKSAHLADKEVLQIEIDMDVHSHSDYCIRTAFRTLYSVMDRIAFFMNEYFSLGIKVEKVSFRSIWNTQNEKSSVLLELCKNNDMLNSIYWLSKDIYEKNYKRTTKPSSKEFDILRNRMEHRYAVSTLEKYDKSDDFTFRISIVDLYTKTLEIMKVVREAIIYLSFALHIEENKKREVAHKDGKVLQQFGTNVIPDICK